MGEKGVFLLKTSIDTGAGPFIKEFIIEAESQLEAINQVIQFMRSYEKLISFSFDNIRAVEEGKILTK